VTESETRRCPTCRQSKAPGEFYSTGTECKDCKRDRSRQNRAVQARKIAFAERLVEALYDLAGRPGAPPAECRHEVTA
jgi:hypothetical protein